MVDQMVQKFREPKYKTRAHYDTIVSVATILGWTDEQLKALSEQLDTILAN